MFSYGKTSQRRIDTCHPEIGILCDAIIKERDVSALCGIRSKKEQNVAYEAKTSKVRWPYSNHNVDPENPKNDEYPDKSMAIDMGEWDPELKNINWDDKDKQWEFAKFVIAVADSLFFSGEMTYRVRSGCDWDQDGTPVFNDPDETFWDGPHFELVKP